MNLNINPASFLTTHHQLKSEVRLPCSKSENYPKSKTDCIMGNTNLKVKAHLCRNTTTLEGELEIRRFVITEASVKSYKALERQVRGAFGNLEGHTLKMFWEDDDGDYVQFSRDSELRDAINAIPNKEAGFKIFITSQSPGGRSSPPPAYGLQRLAVHEGVGCDACRQNPLRGTRYHCKDCPDYDICVPCQKAGKHPGHTLIEIKDPLTREQNMRLMASHGNRGGMSEEDKIALALLLLALGAATQDDSD